jgi:transcriptional regulator with XRE-family HTH domain
MIADFLSKKRRHAFVAAFVRQGVTMQIQLLRKREQWSQKKLGELTDKKQNAITRLEDPSYGKFTLTTLLELAKAFDVALSVRFVPFSELERQSQNLSPEALCVARFNDEVPVPAVVSHLPTKSRMVDTVASNNPVSIQPVAHFGVKLTPGAPTKELGFTQVTGNI